MIFREVASQYASWSDDNAINDICEMPKQLGRKPVFGHTRAHRRVRLAAAAVEEIMAGIMSACNLWISFHEYVNVQVSIVIIFN